MRQRGSPGGRERRRRNTRTCSSRSRRGICGPGRRRTGRSGPPTACGWSRTCWATLHWPGRDFDVKLSGGRFCGITQHGSWLLPSRPALSYLRMQGRTTPFRTLSSFSFEGENGTGLREELGIEGENGTRLSIEYSFCDDSPLLSVNAEISYPRLGAARVVEEYAPLAIALAQLPKGGSVTIEAIAPDESRGRRHAGREKRMGPAPRRRPPGRPSGRRVHPRSVFAP